MRKSDICFYFSITKEENSDFDDNTAGSQTVGAPPGSAGPPGTSADPQQQLQQLHQHQQQPSTSSALLPQPEAIPLHLPTTQIGEVASSEIKITENCVAPSTYLTVHTPSLEAGGSGAGGLSPGGNGNGNGNNGGGGGGGPDKLSPGLLAVSPHPSPGGGAGSAPGMCFGKPSEGNLLLPPSFRRGKFE